MLLVLSVGLFVLGPLPARADEKAKTPPVIHTVDGAEIFHQYCATCHGVTGTGNGPVARDLKHKVPDLTRIARRSGGKFPAERIRSIIEGTETLAGHGTREMPIWGPIFHHIGVDRDLGNVRTDNVTKYIKSLQK
jgi:mono/diheme cytochrome c family protein